MYQQHERKLQRDYFAECSVHVHHQRTGNEKLSAVGVYVISVVFCQVLSFSQFTMCMSIFFSFFIPYMRSAPVLILPVILCFLHMPSFWVGVGDILQCCQYLGYVVSKRRLINWKGLGRSGHGLIEVRSWYSPGGTDENHKRPQS